MPNSVFAFKEFSVRHDKCPLKINTDAVLLGSWARADGAKSILDIGTGTGIIALMLAQRSAARIDAIDIDERCCLQAKDNFSNSRWSKKLKAHHTSLQEYSPARKYDVIVSNPPFFPLPSSHKEKEGAHAKYTHLLSFEDLIDGVVRLLSASGCFYVIFPVHEGAYFTNLAEKRKLFLTDYVWTKTTTRKKFPKRILLKFEFKEKIVGEDKVLVIQNDSGYTDEYKQLTKDYYMKF